MFRTMTRYEEDGLGLPYPVVLVDAAEEEVDEATGERVGISIPDLEGLVTTVAIARSFYPLQLEGAEVRFLRRVLGKSAKELAADLSVDAATFSRWENGKAAVGEWADKQIRAFTALTFHDRVCELGRDSKAIVGMRVRKRQADEWPSFQLIRVHVIRDREPQHDAWEMKLAA
jgi:transcriptional regulator with XRE-family HTH domain